ncbi:MAG: cyclic nucleotide-binding domain-containing protein [Deltaproteobacteria bacterium]|nr:cyclic nucleotide-binding domain-containing protein [Deltaproteobacteria bacterium]
MSALIGASLVVAVGAWSDDARQLRIGGVVVSVVAAGAAWGTGASIPVLALSVVSLATVVVTMRRFLRVQRPTRLDADQLRIRRLVFPNMTPAQLRRLLDVGKWGSSPKGFVLLKASKAPSRVLLVMKGKGAVFIDGNAKGDVLPGQFVGAIGWVTGQPTAYDVRAVEDVRYIEWTREALDELFSRWPDLRALYTVAVAQDLATKLTPG